MANNGHFPGNGHASTSQHANSHHAIPEVRRLAKLAEVDLVAGLFSEPSRISEIVPLISPTDFSQDPLGLIFGAMLSLYGERKPVELTTVAQVLIAQKQIENVGDYAYLAELYSSGSTQMDLLHYARQIRDYSLLRQLGNIAQQIVHRADAPDAPVSQILESAESSIFALAQMGVSGSTLSFSDLIEQALDHIDQVVSRKDVLPGVATGLSTLDELTTGWQKGELIILGARPSVGKTAISLHFARQATAAGAGVLFVSLEQSGLELAVRMLCAEASVSHQAVRRGRLSPADLSNLVERAATLRGLPLEVDTTPRQSVLHIAANARRMKSRGNLGLVVVDYLQLVEPESKREPRHEQVAGISRKLKFLARELEVPVMALAQVNRGAEDRSGGRPRLSDLRESGGIEADADCVILLHRPADQMELLELILAKNRNGPVGELVVRFDRARVRFEDALVADTPFVSGTKS